MTEVYYRLKDQCRNGLIMYLDEAFTFVQKTADAKILDIGCGTGVPTIWMAENLDCSIIAIDTDAKALAWLNRKLTWLDLQNKITALNISFFEIGPEHGYFDIILAEGFLNIAGFEKGFPKAIDTLKQNGYFIIHDEYKDHESKCEFIDSCNCSLTGTIFLDEKTWWNNYYKQLSEGIDALNDKQARDIFKSDLREIEFYRSDPSPFRSIYYIVRKN